VLHEKPLTLVDVRLASYLNPVFSFLLSHVQNIRTRYHCKLFGQSIPGIDAKGWNGAIDSATMATKAVGNSDRFFVFRKSILDQ
jgi:hypothetical protein